jgi:hypothetical protein
MNVMLNGCVLWGPIELATRTVVYETADNWMLCVHLYRRSAVNDVKWTLFNYFVEPLNWAMLVTLMALRVSTVVAGSTKYASIETDSMLLFIHPRDGWVSPGNIEWASWYHYFHLDMSQLCYCWYCGWYYGWDCFSLVRLGTYKCSKCTHLKWWYQFWFTYELRRFRGAICIAYLCFLTEKEEGCDLRGLVTQLRGLDYPCVFRGRGQANIRYGITEITWAFGARIRTDVARYMLRHIRLEDSHEKNVNMMFTARAWYQLEIA